MSTSSYSRSHYNITPATAPPVTLHDLSSDPVWLSACEKLGFHPLEWQTYHPPAFDMEGYRRYMAEVDAEQAAIRADYDAALTDLLEIIQYAPEAIRKALGPCECCDA